jgi:hypothetical protein
MVRWQWLLLYFGRLLLLLVLFLFRCGIRFTFCRLLLLSWWFFGRLWLFESWNLQVDLVDPTIELPGSKIRCLRFLAVEIPETFVDHLESVCRNPDLL